MNPAKEVIFQGVNTSGWWHQPGVLLNRPTMREDRNSIQKSIFKRSLYSDVGAIPVVLVNRSTTTEPELARDETSVVVTTMSTEAEHDRQIVVLIAIICHEQRQLIGKHWKTFLLSEHSN